MDAFSVLDKVERNFGWLFVVWVILFLAFWTAVIVVGVHFLSKVW
jgi:hypothetical protein